MVFLSQCFKEKDSIINFNRESYLMENEFVLIIDFGSQVTQLIARRLRELNVYCEIHPFNKVNNEFLKKNNPKAIILSGGPESVYAKKTLTLDPEILNSNIPILGICYGMQLIAQHFQGKVKTSKKSEFGNTSITLYQGKIFQKLSNKNLNVWMSHGLSLIHI